MPPPGLEGYTHEQHVWTQPPTNYSDEPAPAAPPLLNFPPPDIPIQHEPASKDPAEESQVQALLKVVMDIQGRLETAVRRERQMQGQLEKAERTIESLTFDRDRLRRQVNQLQ